MAQQITKLDEMISQYISKDTKIIDTNISNLTEPGENNGSQIFKVDIKLETQDGENEDLNLVAKQIPFSDFFQKMFNVQVTFHAEQQFYNVVEPTLNNFQKEFGTKILDAFPRFYGARNNLNGINDIVDRDALIVVENLTPAGYKNVDRYMGFDLATSKFVLKHLAYFNAVPLALKLKQPEIFEKKIKPNLTCFLPHGAKPGSEHETDELVKLFEKNPRCKNLVEKIKKSMEYFTLFPEVYEEPLCTVVHRDFWVNNIMVKFENNKAKAIKIIDFQMYSYDTPASDLFFFLFTSVQTDVLKQHLDELLQCYHQNFLQVLSDHQCQTDFFSYDKLMEEISNCTKYQFSKVIFMLTFIVRGAKGGITDASNPEHIPMLNTKHLSKEDEDRIHWIAQECERRGWLKF